MVQCHFSVTVPASMSPASLLTCPVPYYLNLDAALCQASRELCSVPLLRLVRMPD